MHILENEVLRLEIADKGAELSRVRDKELGCERLWSADPAVWNRHAPILFPFVGKVVDGQYRLKGRVYPMKTQHGFARDLDFVTLEESGSSLCQLLCSTAETREIYPFDFRLLVRHRLDGENPRLLHIEWEVTNTGEECMYYAIGGHPGFLPPEGVRKEDCFLGFPGKEHLRYISANPAGFALPDTIHALAPADGAVPRRTAPSSAWSPGGAAPTTRASPESCRKRSARKALLRVRRSTSPTASNSTAKPADPAPFKAQREQIPGSAI